MKNEKSQALTIRPTPGNELVPVGPPVVLSGARPQFRVLIVDNDPAHAESIAESLAGERYDCTVALTGQGGAQLVRQEVFDIIITDLVMNDFDGLDILAVAKEELPEAQVIVVTGYGSIATAVQAMHQGAFYFLQKPLDANTLRTVVERAGEQLLLRRTNAELNRRLDEKFGFENIISASPQMNVVIDRLRRISPTDATVLILGETGVGKDLVAQAIHQNSRRKDKKFVALNCAELSQQILESELFGHVKGAFTDASTDRKGRIEFASGGTLFLDEVGDMPMPVQVKLLRVIEAREIVRVGTNEPMKVDVRILAATNRPLERMVADGTFRQDLYHRLKVATVHIPPLRDRPQDVKLLMDYFLKKFSPLRGKMMPTMSASVRRKLLAYSWPGNVRELANVIEGMLVMDVDGVLDEDDLPQELSQPVLALPSHDAPAGGAGLAGLVGKSMDEVERLFIGETLRAVNNNREEAARMLDIGERTLYRKIRKYEDDGMKLS